MSFEALPEHLKAIYYATGALATGGGVVLAILVLYLRSIFVRKDEMETAMGSIADSVKEVAASVTAMSERMNSQSDRLNQGDSKFAELEERMRHMPSAEAIANLRVSLERHNGDVKAVAARLDGLNTLQQQVAHIDQYLRERT